MRPFVTNKYYNSYAKYIFLNECFGIILPPFDINFLWQELPIHSLNMETCKGLTDKTMQNL